MSETMRLYKFVERCQSNPSFVHNPINVLIAERDKMVDEITRIPIKKPKGDGRGR